MEKKRSSGAVYTRVSTENQAEKDYSSLESQKEHILNFIKSRKFENWGLFGIYEMWTCLLMIISGLITFDGYPRSELSEDLDYKRSRTGYPFVKRGMHIFHSRWFVRKLICLLT